MYKTKHMVDVLKTEELDVFGALISVDSILKKLQSMRINAEKQTLCRGCFYFASVLMLMVMRISKEHSWAQ